MGDRISISFTDEEEESVSLFHHWGGIEFKKIIEKYYKELPKNNSEVTPFDRLEPRVIMVDFIRWLTKDDKRASDSIYLGKDSWDGDNSDNGHWIFNLKTGKWLNKDTIEKDILKHAIEQLERCKIPEKILKEITTWRVAEKI